jgi:hypothetical protein
MKIKVSYPIEVPSGPYCWQYFPPYEICEHFDNEGGHGRCELNLGDLKEAKNGTFKADLCIKLKLFIKE